MADASTIDFQGSGKPLKMTVGKSTYSLALDGTILDLTNSKALGDADGALKTKIAKQLEAAVLENPKMTIEQQSRLRQALKGFAGHYDFAKLTAFNEASADFAMHLVDVAGKGKATPEQIREMGALLAKHPKIEQAMDATALELFNDAELGANKAKAFATKITGATSELNALIKDGKLTEDAAKAVLEKHGHEVVDHLPDTAVKAEVTAAKGAITSKITEIHTALGKHYDDIVKHHTIAIDPISDAKAIAEAEEAIAKIVKDDIGKLKTDNKAYLHYFDEAIESHAHKDLLRSGDIKGVSQHIDEAAAAAKGAAAAAGDKAKWIGGGKFFSFKHTAETVGGELDKIGKFRWGKATILTGAAAVTAVIVAKVVGNTGPGKHAEQAQQQQPGMAQGLGVA